MSEDLHDAVQQEFRAIYDRLDGDVVRLDGSDVGTIPDEPEWRFDFF